MRDTAPPPHKQDNGLDPTHKAMNQRMHRENDHDDPRRGRDDRVVARGDGNRFPRDAQDPNRPEGSREAHDERQPGYRSLAEDRVHGRNDPQRRRYDGADGGRAAHGKQGEGNTGGRYGLQYYADEDRRGYGASYRRARAEHDRYERGVHDLQKDGRPSRES